MDKTGNGERDRIQGVNFKIPTAISLNFYRQFKKCGAKPGRNYYTEFVEKEHLLLLGHRREGNNESARS